MRTDFYKSGTVKYENRLSDLNYEFEWSREYKNCNCLGDFQHQQMHINMLKCGFSIPQFYGSRCT